MFLTKIVLDEEKVIREGKPLKECEETLARIIEDIQFVTEEPHLYVMGPGANSIGVGALLLNMLKISGLVHYLKEWKFYCDEETDDGSLEESDMLALCIRKGLVKE